MPREQPLSMLIYFISSLTETKKEVPSTLTSLTLTVGNLSFIPGPVEKVWDYLQPRPCRLIRFPGPGCTF